MSTVVSSPRGPELRLGPSDARRLPSTALLLEPGPFDIDSLIPSGKCVGLLVLEGLITAEREEGRARVAWLLGADDLIRPLEMDQLTLTRQACWRALTRATVLPIVGAPRDAQIAEQLLVRAARTTSWLLAQSLILTAPTIEERLLLLFAHYGERWGKVTPRGIRLDMALTHELLASLSGARRPTVTLAIRSLTEAGLLARVSPVTWLLLQDPTSNGHSRGATQPSAILDAK